MKKIIALILAVVMCLSLAACSGVNSKQEALELSESIFRDVNLAYEALKPVGDDITSAWNYAIYNEDVLYGRAYDEGFSALCTSVSLSKDEMLDGLGYLQYELNGSSVSDYDAESRRSHIVECYQVIWYFDSIGVDGVLSEYSQPFAACVNVVSSAYKVNGTLENIETLLNSAEENIKTMSERYSDSEHYEFLKKYFSVANAFYDFCSSPSGSLTEAEENISSYNSTATECYNNLYYFFE